MGTKRLFFSTLFIIYGLLGYSLSWSQTLTLTEAKKYSIDAIPSVVSQPGESDAHFIEDLDVLKRLDFTPATSDHPATSFWYLFELKNTTTVTTWTINITNTLVNQVNVHVLSAHHQNSVRSGYIKRIPFDLSNGASVTVPPNKKVRVWVNLQAPQIAKKPNISIQPLQSFSQEQFTYSALIMLALGAMLALAAYNAFLFFPTRDPSFLWYGLYQLLCSFGWAAHFKLLLYGYDIEMDQSTFYLPFYIAGATSLMFAVSFLRLHARNKLTLSIEAFSIAIIVFGVIGLALPFKYYYFSLAVVAYLWMLVMLIVGIRRLTAGFKPARFFVLGFGIMTTFFLATLAIYVSGRDIFDNFLVWALWAQLIDSAALALALADRINFLRKSRQFADKRATTDQLTGLPNRMAFERDVKAWESFYKEGIINDFFLTFIDVDGLKVVNDSKGHNEGDRLLSVMSKWITKQAHQQKVYRVGGDEFLVLSKNHIQWNLPDLHQLVDNAGFPSSDLSIGTSSYSESQSRSQLLKLADERMYALKKSRK